MRNTLQVVKDLIEKARNQQRRDQLYLESAIREKLLLYGTEKPAKPVYNAVVWQCARGKRDLQKDCSRA